MPRAQLVFADSEGRIVTAGGTTSWHDLAIHIISRHCSPGEAIRIAKVYLLKWHGEGQLPYATLFFRRLFKRRTGLTPSQYRRMFQPVRDAATPL